MASILHQVDGCSFGWTAQVFRCFAEHGPLIMMAGAPVWVHPDELFLAFQTQRQAAFDTVPLELGLALVLLVRG